MPKTCPGCRRDNAEDHAYCYHCGTPLAAVPLAAPPGFRWAWVGWSVLIVLGTQFAMGAVLALVLDLEALSRRGDLLAALGLLGLLIGGFIAGYRSPGVTLREPALGAALVAVVFAYGTAPPEGLLIGGLVACGLAYLGAWLGEKLQGKR